MQCSMQTHFDGVSIGIDLCKDLVAREVTHFRIAGSGKTIDQCNIMLADADIVGANHLITLDNLDILKHFKNRNIEWQNEPDGDGRPVYDYTDFMDAYRICKDNHNLLHGPTISNLDQDSLNWLKAFMFHGVPRDIVITYHHYTPDQFFWQPHKGFTSRQEELDMLKSIVGDRRIACSESGYNDSNAQRQANNVIQELQLAAANELEFWTYYQINSDPLVPEYFGARDFDLSWKPVIESFSTYREYAEDSHQSQH